MSVDGEQVDGLPVRMGTAPVRFGLTSHGRVEIVDGVGTTTILHADGWRMTGGLALRTDR
jgi:hypothetical protein